MLDVNKMKVKTRIKEGDEVKIISGKDKGKTGKVTKLLHSKSMIIVDNTNIKTKHYKTRQEQEKGQIKQIAFPVHISNVMFHDSETNITSKSVIHLASSKNNYNRLSLFMPLMFES
uniref:Large ribosomal subunit protein uL24c n=1 Tax=Bulboplastis apyrenoidosa TaxID=1070855 RepID=A0A1X9PVP1_9RHOD|nr:50S ribosomal protein L24 [Bulboplastis apyrenoidosa]ARO90773.1 50S ribosomal protein L24 [Bulboplastis apyrenoidosa]